MYRDIVLKAKFSDLRGSGWGSVDSSIRESNF